MNAEAKIYYILSKKVVNKGNFLFIKDDNEELLIKMKQVSISDSYNQTSSQQPYYIKYDKFCETFKTC